MGTLKLKLVLTSLLVMAGTLALVGFSNAYAQSSSSTQKTIERVQTECEDLKSRLRLTQRNELTTRIGLGRAYDQKILAVVSAFNSRIAKNNEDAPELIRIAADIREAASSAEFGQLYTIYSDDLSEAIASDCEKNPAVTYGWIEKARVDREAMAEKVEEIDTLIEEYIAELKRLEKRFTPAINKSLEEDEK